jgi:two-component system, LuxR family, sensor kinase FixL
MIHRLRGMRCGEQDVYRVSYATGPEMSSDGKPVVPQKPSAPSAPVETRSIEEGPRIDSIGAFEERRARLRGDRLASMAETAVALAHEATQPLTAAANYLSAARHLVGGDPDAAAALEKAETQIVRAGRIIGRLRELIAHDEPETVAQSLHELIHGTSELAATALRRAGVNLTLRLEAADDRVVVDRVEIEQAFINLIRKAIGAAQEAPERTVSIATSVVGGSIETAIACGRAGVSASIEAESLAVPDLVRADELAIARSIIQANRGVWAAPYSVDGVMASFTLPLVAPEQGRG